MSRAEWRTILIGWLLFWTLMLYAVPFPEYEPFGAFYGRSLTSFWDDWIADFTVYKDLIGQYWSRLGFTLVRTLLALAMWLLGFMTAAWPLWYLLPRLYRIYCWNFIGMFSLIVFSVMIWSAFDSYPTWYSQDWMEWQFIVFGYVIVIYFLVTSLCFGHLGSILFAKERKRPASTEA